MTLLMFTLCFCEDKDMESFQSAVHMLRSSMGDEMERTDSSSSSVQSTWQSCHAGLLQELQSIVTF